LKVTNVKTFVQLELIGFNGPIVADHTPAEKRVLDVFRKATGSRFKPKDQARKGGDLHSVVKRVAQRVPVGAVMT